MVRPFFIFPDMKAFLEDAAKELEKKFSTCAFAAVNQVLREHISEMSETVERMRSNARHLCGEAAIPLEASPIANGKHTLCQVGNINFSYKLLVLRSQIFNFLFFAERLSVRLIIVQARCLWVLV